LSLKQEQNKILEQSVRNKSDIGYAEQQREEFRIGFFACFDKIWELINLRNDKQHYQEKVQIFDISTFNERIVREAILNSVAHRNYQNAGSIFVTQYRDRLIVENPGGFPNGVTVENILDCQSPRNRRLAEVFALCGLVERAGQGMNLIYELSVRESKQLPDFTGTDAFKVKLTLNGLMLDERLVKLLKQITNEQSVVLTTDDFLIINALFHGQQLGENLLRRAPYLADNGIIEKVGAKQYVLARSFYELTGTTGVRTRKVGLDKETNKTLILRHIQGNGAKGTPFGELQQVLPSHSRRQIQGLLYELSEEKLIKVVGATSSAKWYPTGND
jgi:ATP-dependent DNA helicase RecG